MRWKGEERRRGRIPRCGSCPNDFLRDLVLFASLPLRTPTLKFSRSATGGLSFNVNGQAGTIVTIYSSTDLVDWSSYYSRSIVTGYSYTVGNPPGSFPRRYFKAVATE